MRKHNLNMKVAELEQNIKELDELANKLGEALSDVDKHFSKLLIKYGAEVRKQVHEQIDEDIDNIEYRILQKLVDGELFELKMKEKKGEK